MAKWVTYTVVAGAVLFGMAYFAIGSFKARVDSVLSPPPKTKSGTTTTTPILASPPATSTTTSMTAQQALATISPGITGATYVPPSSTSPGGVLIPSNNNNQIIAFSNTMIANQANIVAIQTGTTQYYYNVGATQPSGIGPGIPAGYTAATWIASLQQGIDNARAYIISLGGTPPF